MRMATYLEGCVFSHVDCLFLSGFDEISEAVRVCETGTSPNERRNRKGKRSQTIYAPMLHVLSYVSLAGKAKNERVSYRTYRVYIGSHVT